MEAHAHSLAGAVAFAAAAPLVHPSPAGIAAGIIFTAGAGLLPDLDEPGSTLSRESGLVTVALAHAVRKLSGGHRKLSHSFIGVAAFTAASWGAVQASGHLHGYWRLAGLAFLWAFLQCLLAAALHALRLGRRSADPVAALAAAAAVWQHWGLGLVPLCIAAGSLAHIGGDMVTHHGCPVLYPASRRDFGLLPGSMRITTGKWAEHCLASPLLLAVLGVLAWRDVSASGFVHHVHATLTSRSAP